MTVTVECPTCGAQAHCLGRLRRRSTMFEFACQACGYRWTEHESQVPS